MAVQHLLKLSALLRYGSTGSPLCRIRYVYERHPVSPHPPCIVCRQRAKGNEGLDETSARHFGLNAGDER